MKITLYPKGLGKEGRSICNRISLSRFIGCHSLASLAVMAKIVEHAMECYFRVQPKLLVESLRLPRDPAMCGWQHVTTSLVLPETSLHEFLQICVSEFSVLVLHTHILQRLHSGRSAQQEMEVAVQVVQWCTQVKPKLAVW